VRILRADKPGEETRFWQGKITSFTAIKHANEPYSPMMYPIDFKVREGSKRESPDELTSVGNWGE
jgi:hypothetical protein